MRRLCPGRFVGGCHGGIGLCVIFVDAEPGRGPDLHTHPSPRFSTDWPVD
jgi:hypothetical protein